MLFLLCLINLISYTQKITHGPDVGEIYFLGPNNNGEGLYYSTDFGETATFVDGSKDFISIAADKTKGGIYCTTLPIALYYSDGFGNTNTWEFKFYSDYLSNYITSGIIEGYIFSDCYMHSEDYGSNFTIHQLNNYYGTYMESEIGYDNKGYLMTYEIGGNDTLYFFVSNDNFDSFELVHKFNVWGYGLYDLSFGYNNGDLFFYNSINKNLFYSEDDGYNWVKKNTFTCPNLPIVGITGGRQDGELYMLVQYIQLSGQIIHIYGYHSLDNGETFTINHPVSIGPDPIYANFIAEDTLVEPGETIQFTSLNNSPEIYSWEWDFNNDGIIDSYDQDPSYVYEDTGYYSVKLRIQAFLVDDSAFRYNYVHVSNLININENTTVPKQLLKCYPNPFNSTVSISCFGIPENSQIRIFDMNGRGVKTIKLSPEIKTIHWDSKDNNGNYCKPGLYFIMHEKSPYIQKVILTN